MSSVAAAQIAQYGIENKFVRGEPSTTYFKALYSRHTNFAIQPMKVDFDTEVSLGTVNTITIPRNGDLIKEVTIRMELPQLVKNEGLDPRYDDVYPVWTNSIPEAIVERAELVIGNETIQELTGEMSFIKSELETPESHYEALQQITNRFMNLSASTTSNGKFKDQISQGTVFMQMRFFFHRHPELAIPLIALKDKEVQIRLTLRPFTALINAYRDATTYQSFNQNPTTLVNEQATGPIIFTPIVEYVFLDQMEREQFISGKEHHYLIEQTQYFQPEFVLGSGSKTANIYLPFRHLVKEMIIVFIQQNRYTPQTQYGNQVFNFSGFLQELILKFNGEERVSKEVGDQNYLRRVQPILYHTRTPLYGVYTYSFAIDPESVNPTGTANFNRISKVLMSIEAKSDDVSARETHIHATSWNILKISNGDAEILFK